MVKNFTKIFNKYVLIILGLCLVPAIWALFVPGYFGASDDLHIAWLYEMDQAVLAGQIPPRFVPNLSFGYGYPLFNFVFPLPFYIGELFHLVGFNLVDSIKIVLLLSLVISGFAMYFLGREFSSKSTSFIVALLYTYTPYRSVDVYGRGALGESFTFVFLPLILLAFVKSTAQQFSLRWSIVGGLGLGGLILTHNITAYMFVPFAVLFLILRLIFSPQTAGRKLLTFFLPLIGGLLVSSYFWVPALFESNLMQYSTVFNFIDHSVYLKQFFWPYWGYGASVAGPYDGMSFFWGAAQILSLVSAILFFIFKFKQIDSSHKVVFLWSIFVILISVYMTNFRSTPVWESVPFIQYFQFPWRFLILITLAIPLTFVVVDKFKYKNYLLWILGLICLAQGVIMFQPNDFLGRQDDYYLNRYVPSPSASEEYKGLQEEYLRLTKYTQKRPSEVPALFSTDAKITNLQTQNGLVTSAQIISDKDTFINYNKYYFPGWMVKVNGKSQAALPQSPYGTIGFNLPEGQNQVEIRFGETPMRMFVDYLSLGVLVLFLIGIIWKPKTSAKN